MSLPRLSAVDRECIQCPGARRRRTACRDWACGPPGSIERGSHVDPAFLWHLPLAHLQHEHAMAGDRSCACRHFGSIRRTGLRCTYFHGLSPSLGRHSRRRTELGGGTSSVGFHAGAIGLIDSQGITNCSSVPLESLSLKSWTSNGPFADIGEHQPDAPKATFASTAAANLSAVHVYAQTFRNRTLVQADSTTQNGRCRNFARLRIRHRT